jgi:hypothetical protein
LFLREAFSRVVLIDKRVESDDLTLFLNVDHLVEELTSTIEVEVGKCH